MKQSRTVAHPVAVESPRHLPLVDLLVDARTELFELAVRSGLKVLDAMLEEDRTVLCGPRYAHLTKRCASRAGTVSGEVVLGGRKVAVRRPRVRAEGQEVPLPTFQAMADNDPLNRRVVEQMLVGVATRRYARSLEPVPATMMSRGTSKSAVSRRFVAKTAAQLAAWQTAALEGLDLVGLLIDGVHIGEHCLIVALGIAADGQKHALGLWDGSTENARVCQDLLANLHSRGLRTDRSLLVILDGSKALRKAVRTIFGEAALVQRCQVHKMRNVLEYLSDRDRPWAQAILRRAYQANEVTTAQRLLVDLARRLETEYPSAAESVREGLDETLTVLTLKLSPRLRRSLATTNAAESLISRTRLVKRNVKRWRGGQMMLRWVAAGILEAVKGFRRVKGYPRDQASQLNHTHVECFNPHAHLMISERQNDGFAREREQWFRRANPSHPERGGAPKSRTFHGRSWMEHACERWATLTNAMLAERGRAERVDHRSYERQGIDREPGSHFGPAAAYVVARGRQHDRLDEAAGVSEYRDALHTIDDEIGQMEHARAGLSRDQGDRHTDASRAPERLNEAVQDRDDAMPGR